MKTAIILGSTGLTGSVLLNKLLQDEEYSKIKLFSRSPSGQKSEKVEEYLVDLFELDKSRDNFTGDVVFCCIGTTKKKTPDEITYKKIDYGIPVSAAALAKENNIPGFLVISSLGADSRSRLFYNRTKGEMERDVLNQKIPNTYFFRPSLIAGQRKEKRLFEQITKKMMVPLNRILTGSLKKYRSISPQEIADAMIFVARSGYFAIRIESDEIREIAKRKDNA